MLVSLNQDRFTKFSKTSASEQPERSESPALSSIALQVKSDSFTTPPPVSPTRYNQSPTKEKRRRMEELTAERKKKRRIS